jgi:hypothetical protein
MPGSLHNSSIKLDKPFIVVLTQTNIPRFEVKQTTKLQLTSYSDLALIAQCFEVAQLELVIDLRVPVSKGMRTWTLKVSPMKAELPVAIIFSSAASLASQAQNTPCTY